MAPPKRATVELTNEAYARWLRAGSPQPIAWFLALEDDNQEQLAILGDEHAADIAVAIGYAVVDPSLADAGLDAKDNPESEEVLLRRMAADLASKLLQQEGPAIRSRPPAPTMGGVTKRREEAALADQKDRDVCRSFLGTPPDEATL